LFPLIQNDFVNLLTKSGFTDEVKLQLFPRDKHHILLRITHIGDPYDTKNSLKHVKIDLMHLVTGLYELVNDDMHHEYDVHLSELSLTGNQDFS
jgi:hypothetical protein